MARPSEYTPEIIEKAKKYLLSCEDQEVTRGGKGDNVIYRLKAKLPTIEGLALYIGISRETVYDWEKKYPEFSDIIGNLRAEQADRLINNGLSGDYNPTIAKVLLTKHGYNDKVDTDITSGGKEIKAITGMVIAKDDEARD